VGNIRTDLREVRLKGVDWIKDGEFDYVSDCQLLKKDSAPWN